MASIDTLAELSTALDVSLDWLVLPLSQPYNEEKLLLLEKNICAVTVNIPIKSDIDSDYYAATWFMRDPIGQHYLDLATRRDYSLSVRANILYCLHVLSTPIVSDQKKYSELREQCRKILEDYIVHKKNIAVPVFDITKEPT